MIETPPPYERVREQEPSPLAPAPIQKASLNRSIRKLLFGNPISSEHAEHTLLSKIIALPVFASDAISSTAYATQEIILALGAAGMWLQSQQGAYSNYTMLIASLIVGLLVIVVTSYWQTIHAYPSGGGSYIVSKENLGANYGLIAAGALLIDYVLTVSVSIAAGVQNLASVPFVEHYLMPDRHLVLYCLLFIALLTLANFRGLKESGSLFAIPTYIFVLMCYIMIGVGACQVFGLFGMHAHTEEIRQIAANHPQGAEAAAKAVSTFGWLILLKAFANGCAAMTGTEAVSNGIPAFQEPKSRNAQLTLLSMGIILGSLFLGISWLATQLHIVYYTSGPNPSPAVIDQISGAIFGKTGSGSIFYLTTQFFTAAILVLAANTSYADFPRLASILARDRYMPKQFSNLGDKLVFNNGIMLLGVFAAVLIVVKKGEVDALIPLYATGVFTAFTLSQAGMVKHWFDLRERGWQMKAVINGVGAIATTIVLVTIVYEKFTDGAWIIVFLIALLFIMFKKIHGHYLDVAQQLKLANYESPVTPLKNTVLVLVPALHRGVMPALDYARSLSSDCRAVHICTDPERTPQLRERWEQWGHDVPLVILNSPYRSLLGPIMRYLDAVQHERRNHTVTVVVPEFVPTKKWHALLHGQSGFRLKLALLSRRDVVVANVRYYLQHSESPPPSDALAEEDAGLHDANGHHGHQPPTDLAESIAQQAMETPTFGSAQDLALAGDTGYNAPDAQTSAQASEANGQAVSPTGTLEEQRAYETGLNNPPVARRNDSSWGAGTNGNDSNDPAAGGRT